MVFTVRKSEFRRGRYAHFSVQWSDQKSIRDLVSSILREPPNIARIKLGYEPYMLGKSWMSSFQRFLQFKNPTSIEGDMPTLVRIGQQFRDSGQLSSLFFRKLSEWESNSSDGFLIL